MTKIPCGGFKLDENFFGMNENDELSLVGGGYEGQNKNLVLSSLGGNVRWQNYPYHVTVNVTSNFSKATCDTPFMGLAALIADDIPIMATVVVQGAGSTLSGVVLNDEGQIVFPYDPVTGKNLIYHKDGSFSGLVG